MAGRCCVDQPPRRRLAYAGLGKTHFHSTVAHRFGGAATATPARRYDATPRRSCMVAMAAVVGAESVTASPRDFAVVAVSNAFRAFFFLSFIGDSPSRASGEYAYARPASGR